MQTNAHQPQQGLEAQEESERASDRDSEVRLGSKAGPRKIIIWTPVITSQSGLRQTYSKFVLNYSLSDVLHEDEWPLGVQEGLIINIDPPNVEQKLREIFDLSQIPADEELIDQIDKTR